MKKILHSAPARLLILTFLHFAVDFAGGLQIPLPEPTLTGHLGARLPLIAAIIGGTAILANAIQPLSGWLMPERGIPKLLVAAPLVAALKDPDAEVRREAVWSLGEIGPAARSSISMLGKAIVDNDYVVRYAAGDTQKRIRR